MLTRSYKQCIRSPYYNCNKNNYLKSISNPNDSFLVTNIPWTVNYTPSSLILSKCYSTNISANIPNFDIENDKANNINDLTIYEKFLKLSKESELKSQLIQPNYTSTNNVNNTDDVNTSDGTSINYKKFVDELIQWHYLDAKALNKLVNKHLNDMNLSIVINLLVKYNHFQPKDSDRLSFKSHSELIFKVYQIYIERIEHPILNSNNNSHIQSIAEHSSTPLNPIQLYDLNKVITWFIKAGQLKKATTALMYILKRYNAEIFQIPDSKTIINFLKLYCGGLPTNWRIEPINHRFIKNQGKRSFKLGNNSSYYRLPSSYKAVYEKVPIQIVEHIKKNTNDMKLSGKLFHFIRTGEFDSTLIYSLTSLGRFDLAEQYFKDNWLSDSCDDVELTSDIVIAIFSSYVYNNSNNIEKANKLIQEIIKRYPDLHLNISTWCRIIRWNIQMWDTTTDFNGEIPYDSFYTMLTYYSNYCSRNSTFKSCHIPYNKMLLGDLYHLFNTKISLNKCLFIMDNCFKKSLFKTPSKVTTKDYQILLKYQKMILKYLINDRKLTSNKPLDFIEKYSLDTNNKEQLLEYRLERLEYRKSRKEYYGNLNANEKNSIEKITLLMIKWMKKI
ncbi:hypothetical protein TBLA_0B03310 [Henningerozyma blattae CBS 6284]|uniref:ATPase expression protein 2, mitochondrial n=1 Tax=Henningerozyma blattae (strain ATCC 34711 / CBS 6284 / DSM 70876 / NBRC 10599 / NRRL Y-10934 / UCD 77-7) TaxID=1071380 RepID=I2GYH0_HENB6|nr:hypothetical protein TBLA_0B03310 [Tetrapisispora blattae CBS 6284]CCH59172.1 hypothetical protein TBLA_0B03310 [Tetrapisispora blattae CBS 6284]